jgi:hypothetical protein
LPAQCWPFPFTTHLQEQDQSNDFRWRGCAPGSPAALRATVPLLAPGDLPVPTGELAELARRGPKKSFAAPSSARLNPAPATGGKPAAAQAGIPSAKPLRLREKALGTAARIDEEASDEPRHASSARRLVPLAGVILLFLFLATGFWKPGWLKPRGGAATPSTGKSELSLSGQSARDSQTGNGVVLTNAEDFSKASAETKPQPSTPPKSLPSASAIAELNLRFDAMPTYLHIHNFATPLELRANPKLISLFTKIMANEGPVPESAIECRAAAEVLRLDTPDVSGAMRIRINKEEKHLRGIRDNTAMEEFRIQFNEWFIDPARAMSLHFTEPPRASLLIWFQPKGGSAFEPFRILIASDREKPVPVQLSKGFLSVDQAGFDNTVDPLVRDKLKSITLPPKARLQLRPFVEAGGRPRELGEAFQLAQAEGTELGLRLIRDELARRVVATNILRSNTLAEVTRLNGEVSSAHASDVELGRLLGHEGNSFVSFRAFAQDPAHKAGRMDRAAFKRYLHQVLKGKIDDKELKKLDAENTVEEALKQLDEHLTRGAKAVPNLQPNYFRTRWGNLGQVEKLAAAERAHKSADKSLNEATQTMARAPKGLDDLVYVSLVMLDGGHLLELIRFTDPPKKTKP